MKRQPTDGTATRIRLTSGDYYEPGDYFERVLRRNATAYFLATLARHHKQVLRVLKGQVLPAFRNAVEELEAANRRQEAQELREVWGTVNVIGRDGRLDQLVNDLPGVDSLRALKESLARWAFRFGLNIPRLRDTALATVAAWHADPDRRLLWNHWRASEPEALVPKDVVIFEVNAWSPRAEPKVEARRRMRKFLLEQVEKYLDGVERDRLSQGWQPAPTKDQIEEHCRLLALYQVDGLSISEIARRQGAAAEKVDRQRKGVAAAIDSAGQLIAGRDWPVWKRKASQGGRPRKA
jgi:hypothetical protein